MLEFTVCKPLQTVRLTRMSPGNQAHLQISVMFALAHYYHTTHTVCILCTANLFIEYAWMVCDNCQNVQYTVSYSIVTDQLEAVTVMF